MTDTTLSDRNDEGRERKPGEPGAESSTEENPFTDAELDLSDFGENPDTETTG